MRRLLVIGLLFVLSGPHAPTVGTVLVGADLTDEYSSDEVPAELVGVHEWLGLYVAPDGASDLRATDARWVETKEQGSVMHHLAVNPPGPIFAVSGVPGLSSGRATTLARDVELSREAPTVRVSLGSATYVLRLTGDDPSLCDARVTLTDGDSTQTLYEPSSGPYACDGPQFTLHWAGDLDGDGRLDLVTTLSSKYSYYPRALYLSSAAGDGRLVALAARFERLD